MAFSPSNEIGSTLASGFVHGTDTSLVLVSASGFPTGGGYIRVGAPSAAHWALYKYTGVSTNTLTGLTLCTLGNVQSEASYTFAAATAVTIDIIAEYIADIVTALAAKLSAVSGDTAPTLGGNLDLSTFSEIVTPTLGSDHTYVGKIGSVTVGATVAFGNLLYKDLTDNEFKLADADQIATMPGCCIALESKNDGEACKVLWWGFIRDDSWSFTVDNTVKRVYTSLTAGGVTTSAASWTTGDLVQVVGQVFAAHVLFFNPTFSMVEVA